MNSWFKPTLLKKFLITFLIVAVIPLLIAGYFTLQRSEEELKSSLNEQYHLLTEQVRRTLDEVYIKNWVVNLTTLSAVLTADNSTQDPQTLLNTYLQQTNPLLVLTLRSAHTGKPLQLFKPEQIAKLYPQDPEQVKHFFDFFSQVGSGGNEPRVGEPIRLSGSNQIFLPVEIPFRSSDGTPATLRGVFQMTGVIDAINRDLSVGNREVYIVDHAGQVIFASENAGFAAGDSLKYPIMKNVRVGLQSTVRAFQVETFFYQGKTYLGNFSITQYTDWAIVLVDHYQNAYALVNQTKRNIYFWVAVAIILSIAFSIFFARSFSRSIGYLAKKSHQIGEGDFDIEIAVPSRDEIGQLAASLQEMVNHLKESVKVREELVAIQQEVEIASRIQHSILPDGAPEMASLTFEARYLPMAGVAGDFYDFHLLDDHRLGVLIADVSGHGIPAALISAMAKIAFSLQSATAEDPGEVIRGMNRTLEGKTEDQFLTACYVLIDLQKKELITADAGHPPLLIWRRETQEIVELKPKGGMLMAWMPEIKGPSERFDLISGDRIIFYTDGIPEAADPSGELFGEKRFNEFIGKHQDTPPRQFIDATIEHLKNWHQNDAGFDDDITMIVLDIE